MILRGHIPITITIKDDRHLTLDDKIIYKAIYEDKSIFYLQWSTMFMGDPITYEEFKDIATEHKANKTS